MHHAVVQLCMSQRFHLKCQENQINVVDGCFCHLLSSQYEFTGVYIEKKKRRNEVKTFKELRSKLKRWRTWSKYDVSVISSESLKEQFTQNEDSLLSIIAFYSFFLLKYKI